MLHQVKDVIRRSDETLFQDVVGVLSLVVMLVVGLHLPGLF